MDMKKVDTPFPWKSAIAVSIVMVLLWVVFAMFANMRISAANEETPVSITVVTTNAAPVVTPAVEEIEMVLYFDVPLDKDLQDYIFEECETYGIDPAIIIAMIDKESKCKASVIGDNGRSFGLMQIQARWHYDRMARLGVDDLLDPYQNVIVGIDYLAELIGRGKGLEWALMAYNGGPSYANKKAASGVVSNYAQNIIEKSKGLRRV